MLTNQQFENSSRARRKPAGIVAAGAAIAALLCGIVAPAQAKDLYVATDGDDNVSYDSNSINNPWRTILHGVYNLRAGDTLYIRGGTYRPQYTMVVKNQTANQQSGHPGETMNAESGTASNPIRITSQPGERAIIDCADIGAWLRLDAKDYWEISDLDFINTVAVVVLGEDSTADNNTIRGNRITMNRGGDNTAAVKIWGERAEFTVIEANDIIGPGTGSSIHSNTATIFLRRVKNVKIIGNRLSNAPMAVYYKHATLAGTAADTDIEISYNYITDTGRNAMQLNSNRAHIHNNIFGRNNAGIIFAEANGQAGGDFNVVTHNTFFQTPVTLPAQTSSGDANAGSYGNIFRDNIFWSAVGIHPYETWAHATELDYNVHVSSTAVAEHRVNYSLSQWQSHAGNSMNSISGNVSFSGGSSPNSVDGFRLLQGSTGTGSASDGLDVGANVDLVGANAPIRPKPPNPLN